jgi:hypothetical protein
MLVTTGMLPPVLRERFGLGWSRVDELELGLRRRSRPRAERHGSPRPELTKKPSPARSGERYDRSPCAHR